MHCIAQPVKAVIFLYLVCISTYLSVLNCSCEYVSIRTTRLSCLLPTAATRYVHLAAATSHEDDRRKRQHLATQSSVN